MLRSTLPLTLSLAMFGPQVLNADVPNVVTDIPPVQSLVAQVMGDLGQPSAIVPATANAHAFALRPSDARELAGADVVFWMGADYIPTMERALQNLSGTASIIGLLAAEETVLIEVGDEDDHDDDHDEEDHDDHGAEDHYDHGDHGDHGDDHDDHDEEHHDDHGAEDHDDHGDEEHDDHHDHSGVDPHAWMSPTNAHAWLGLIASTLSDADPENAAAYQANAAAAQRELAALTADLMARGKTEMGPHDIVTFHDTLRYFEATFDTGDVIAIPMGDGLTATPSQMAELRAEIAEHDLKCALTDEPGETTGMTAMAQEAGLQLVVLNPLGAGLEPGASLYNALIQRTYDTLFDCRK